MSIAVVVQTCDRYRPYWGGFLHFMERHWDFDIKAPIFLCNEEEDVELPSWCGQFKTGSGTFVENLTRSLELVGEEHVFLMLEDFWPIAPMGRGLFDELYGEFRSRNLDALQVSNYTPYYTLSRSDRTVRGSCMLDFDPKSEWVFNLQARFWKTDVLRSCLVEPDISEREVGSAITAEMASDEAVRDRDGLKASLFHYLWYPLSGVAYRGQMTDFGRHLQNILEIDRHVAPMVS